MRSPYFQVEKLKLDKPLQADVSPSSPHIVVAIEGAAMLESEGMAPISFAKGEAVVVPASVRQYVVRPQWDVEVMRMSLPTGNIAEPPTKFG